jgi:uncharacterized protein YjbI with pentapeptide repeats
LRDLDLRNTRLLNLDLGEIDFRRSRFDDADVTGTFFDDAILDDVSLRGVHVSEYARVMNPDEPTVSFRRAQMTGAVLSGARIPGADLGEAVLFRAKLDATTFDDANLRGADLRYTRLCDQPSFRGATLDGASLANSHQDGSGTRSREGGPVFHGASMLGTNLRAADLSNAEFCEMDVVPPMWHVECTKAAVFGEGPVFGDAGALGLTDMRGTNLHGVPVRDLGWDLTEVRLDPEVLSVGP